MSLIRGRQGGFTLIEVLIALLVLAIGLLGMASLTMTSLQSNQSAYQRGQASLLAGDIVERMRGNSAQALIAQSPYLVSLTSSSTLSAPNPPCRDAAAGCTPSQQATQDLFEWWTNVQRSIPGASATITRANTNEFTIAISWNESDAQQRATQTSSFTLRVNL